MPRSRDERHPHAPAPVPPAIAAPTVVLVSLAAGAAGRAWSDATLAAFGRDPAAVTLLSGLAVIAVVLGIRLESRKGNRPSPVRGVGLRLIALGILSLAPGFLSGSAGRALVWAGGSLDAGPVVTGFARLLIGGLLLLPGGVLAGTALPLAARGIPGGRAGGALLAGIVAGAGGGYLLGLALPLAGAGPPTLRLGGGAVLVLAGILLGVGGRPGASPPDTTLPAGPGRAAGLRLAAGGCGFTVASLSFLSGRVLLPVFGNDLPEIPVAAILFAGSFLAGALAAVPLAGLRAHLGGGRGTGGVLILVGVAATLGLYARFDQLPGQFAALVADAGSFGEIARRGFLLALPSVAPGALLVGLATAGLVGSAPSEPTRRPGWLARVAPPAALGWIAGAGLSRFALEPLGTEGTVLACALVAAALGAGAIATDGRPSVLRIAIPLAALGAVGIIAFRIPAPDRLALLVERDLVSPTSPLRRVQKHWKVYDEDCGASSVAVLKRGHVKRLLVNGRFEMSNLNEIKSHGMLAHLPLAIHPDPKRVCLLGSGNGIAVAAALSHPIEVLDLLAAGRPSVEATGHFGPRAERALRDGRVRVRVGDPEDLLARSAGYDVILNQASGVWTPLSARLSTREFLETAKERLSDSGIYCQWIAGSSLTKDGLLILLRTIASVFPRVEVWAGQGGDVLLLAKRRRAPHDLEAVLAACRRDRTAESLRAAWIEDPVTLLSQYLVGDETVRRISGRRPVHSRARPRLGAAEVARRTREGTVNPVPGLAEIRDDVLDVLENVPDGFPAAVARALQVRDLERKGLDLELEFGRTEGIGRKAAAVYERALELNPRDGAVRRALASLRTRIGIEYSNRLAFTAAYSNMLQAVETDTTYAEGFGNLGLLLLSNETFDYALAVTRQALELEPDDDLMVYQLARIWKRRGYYDRALVLYEKAMEMNPLHVEAAMGYSDTLLAIESDPDLEKNLAFLEEYLALEPDNEDLRFRIGKLQYAIENRPSTPPEMAIPEAPLLKEIEEPSAGSADSLGLPEGG